MYVQSMYMKCITNLILDLALHPNQCASVFLAENGGYFLDLDAVTYPASL
jgi:hypothetical protein